MRDLPYSSVELLDRPLTGIVEETGAFGGAVLLLPPGGERVLRLATMVGIPLELARPWMRVGLDAPIPLAQAVRERRLLWVAADDMARRYPQAAVSLPVPFAVADVPIVRGDVCWGALVLLWLGTHAPELAYGERALIQSGCRRLGQVLDEAAAGGRPVRPGQQPRVVARPRVRTPAPAEAIAAADFAERISPGCCGLDLQGRVAFVSTTAAELVGASVEELLGAWPWDVLPWADGQVYEDRYRTALMSGRPTSFTARRPPGGELLRFGLHPDASGVSLLITRDGEAAPDRDAVGERGGAVGAGSLYHVMQFAAALTEAAGVKDVVDLVANQLMPAFDAQGLVLFLADGPRLRVIGHRGYAAEVMERLDGARFGSPTGQAVRALTEGVPEFFATPEELREAGERGQPRLVIPALVRKSAWAHLPLVTSGQPVGCCVLSYDRPHEFPVEERTVLTSLAGLIAQSLERARLHDATHQLARRLQEGLLPRGLPGVPGLRVVSRYLPATHGMDIGGDFYDVIRLKNHIPAAADAIVDADDAVGTAAAAIGDVQGHNVTAAALMGQVRTAVHAAAGASPTEVLARTNQLIIDLDPGLFTSCLYVHLDLAGHRARLANAGHPPPLLRHPDGRVSVLRMPPGPLLGIMPEAEYPAMEIPLPPGSVLILYTDGLVESPDIDLDEATDELARHLTSAGPAPGQHAIDILANTLQHLAEQRMARGDDIALLLLGPQ